MPQTPRPSIIVTSPSVGRVQGARLTPRFCDYAYLTIVSVQACGASTARRRWGVAFPAGPRQGLPPVAVQLRY